MKKGLASPRGGNQTYDFGPRHPAVFPFREGLGTAPDIDVGSLQQLVEEGSHLRLVGGTHVLVDELAVLEEEERRDVAHGILHGDVLVLLDVALADDQLAVVLLSEF